MFTDKARSSRVSDTVEFRHSGFTVPYITLEDKVIHAISQLKRELASIHTPNKHNQLEAISHLRNLFYKCSRTMKDHSTMKDANETSENIRD